MRLLALTILCVLAWGTGAHAQALQRVTNCGDGNPPAGASPGTQDATGKACVSGTFTGAPTATTPTPSPGTITLGNTFQTALAASATRKSCLIQNTSTHTLYVFDGVAASATLLKSLQISAQGTFSCQGVGGTTVTTNEISVTTSTTSDTFVLDAQQ